MKIEEFRSTFGLHDMGVDRLKFDQEAGAIRIDTALNQSFHPCYRDDMPELVAGTLTLSGVKNLTYDPPDYRVVEGIELDAEVLEFKRVKGDHWKLVMSIFERGGGGTIDVLVMDFAVRADAQISFAPAEPNANHLGVE